MKLLLIILWALCAPLFAEPLTVAVSVPPQATFVERVGGQHVAALVMVPEGASPHTYDLRPGQLVSLSNAALYITVGAEFAFEQVWMDRIRSVNTQMAICNSGEGIDLLAEHTHDRHHGADAHHWLSPRRSKMAVTNICRALSRIDPQNATTYAQNRDLYLSELDGLNTELTDAFAQSESRAFMVYHPAWAYVAHDFGLTQIAIERDGKAPTPRTVVNLVEQARRHHLKTIIVAPQFSTRSAEVIAREIDGHIVSISPLNRDPARTLRRFAQAILEQQ